MAAEPLKDTIFEEREDFMVSPTGGTPTLRTAHFLKPTTNSITGPTLKPPSLSLSSESKWPLKVSFNGWRDPPRKWKIWVDKMDSIHQSVWKKAGIYEAIMGSKYQTRRNNELIFGISERWCSETNTFIFPWGEATITLEDMMILGGFSVLGGSVLIPMEKELIEIEENLKTSSKGLTQQSEWLSHFMESGTQFEHEAFLSLWLSRFVFPGNVFDNVGKHVFRIAIHLSRGTRIALGPAVLASLYRDLSLLKETIAASSELDADSEDSYLALTLWAPLRWVQIWAWERLPTLRPKPNFINVGEMRLARWHSLKKLNIENIRLIIDSAGENFQWRPYAMAVDNWLFPKFYKEKEHWVSCNMGSELDEELESFARCLRACELVGIDCIEPYLPHRVAMQFGIDQDLPGWIPRSMATPEIAWNNYSRPFRDAKIYIPPRLFESDITTRYLEWWKISVLTLHVAIEGVVKRKRSSRRSQRLLQKSKGIKGGNDADVPPGFPPKCAWVEGNKHTLVGMLQTSNKCREDRPAYEDKPLVTAQFNSLSSPTAGNGDFRRMELLTEPRDNIMQIEAAIGRSQTATAHANVNKDGSPSQNVVSIYTVKEDSSSDFTFQNPKVELEDRISKLERVVAGLKETRLRHSDTVETTNQLIQILKK